MKAYVASGLPNWKTARAVMNRLQNHGIEITYDWTSWGEKIFGDGKSPPKDIKQSDADRKEIGNDEYNGVMTADILLVLLPGGRGTHFELGARYAAQRAWLGRDDHLGIWIVTGNDADGERPISFHYSPGIKRTDTIDEAVEQILEYFGITVG